MWIDDKTYNLIRSKVPVPAADGVIIKENEVLLLKRNFRPKGSWCLPGGQVNYREKVEDTVCREVLEETGLRTRIKKLIGVYSDPKRDSKWHAVSVAYLLDITGGKLCINEESSKYGFFPIGKLPKNMAFDHRNVIRDAFKILKTEGLQ